MKAAGLSKEIILKIQPFQQFEQPKEKSIIITNPPYGERISTNDLLGLYQMIGERLKHSFTGNDAWVLSYREECFDQIGLKPSIKIPLFNGSLECEFRKYQLFNGKFKEFRSENADQEFKPRREEIRPRRNTEKVEYGERRERRSFDNRREGHGEYKEESAEKDALLMTNVRDVAISKEENTATLVTDVKAATISKAVPVNLTTIRKRQKNKQL